MLRRRDLSPIHYKRVAQEDGKEVPWDDIVKGYEYEKGKYVVLTDEDFERVDVEANQAIDIINFVAKEKVNPILFYKPYCLEVGKGGDKAYVLLRDALEKSGKVAIAKVVIRTREHLAAIRPDGKNLMLELMHFPDELLDLSEFKTPSARSIGKPEMKMAQQLINSMTSEWDPSQYKDDYKVALEKLIEDKIEHGDDELPPPPRKKKPTNVVDLVSILQRSIRENRGGRQLAKRKVSSSRSRKRKTKKRAA